DEDIKRALSIAEKYQEVLRKRNGNDDERDDGGDHPIDSGLVANIVNDFSTDANPHRGWSYGSSKSVTGFDPYTNNKQVRELYASRGQAELIGWSRPESPFPFVAQNLGTATLYQRWRPTDVVLHPSVALFSIVRWTNPAPGTSAVHLYATFRRVEDVTPNASIWYVVANGKVVESGSLDLGNEERSVSKTLEVEDGGSIALVVGCKDHLEGTDLSVSARIESRSPSLMDCLEAIECRTALSP
ncbi:MAG TPA: hypothetical protein VKR27_03630, partial [Acidimicrobiales bacterium]|nr:hypothetical protein [Acidimicrobiales bacterium]